MVLSFIELSQSSDFSDATGFLSCEIYSATQQKSLQMLSS